MTSFWRHIQPHDTRQNQNAYNQRARHEHGDGKVKKSRSQDGKVAAGEHAQETDFEEAVDAPRRSGHGDTAGGRHMSILTRRISTAFSRYVNGRRAMLSETGAFAHSMMGKLTRLLPWRMWSRSAAAPAWPPCYAV